MKISKPSIAEAALFLLLGALFLFLISFVVKYFTHKDDILKSKLQSAELLVKVSIAAHEQYSSSINGLSSVKNLTLTTNAHPSVGELHFPASFSNQLSKRLLDLDLKTQLLIYSDDPFEEHRTRKLDQYQQNALASFRSEGVKEFWEVSNRDDGTKLLRYSVPMRMKLGCTVCHNQQKWGLNKKDWQVGDIRGVREASITYQDLTISDQLDTVALLVISATSCLAGIFIGYPAIRREVRQRTELERISGELKQKTQILEHQALTDALSGLRNRRFFDAALTEYIYEFQRIAGPIGLLVFDIDKFKQLNDTHGHAVGDEYIKEFGNCIKQHARRGDVAARIGGEEFALLIAGASEQTALKIAERIRIAASHLCINVDGKSVLTTVSIGLAVMKPDDTPSQFLKRADDNLYRAKHAGRNRICA